MIRPGVVTDATVDCLIRVSRPFGAELPYCPVVWMFGIEKGDEAVEGVAVGSLGICLARPRSVRKQSAVSMCESHDAAAEAMRRGPAAGKLELTLQ